MTVLVREEHTQERPEMREKPRLFDDLVLVALPTAVSCARLFVRYTLDNWRASSFVVADAMTIAGELVALSVAETGIPDDEIRWSELDHLNRIVVRLLGFAREIVIEVWDVATKPAAVSHHGPSVSPYGLDLVDIVASRWTSTISPRGRLTWAVVNVYDQAASGLQIRRRTRPAQPVSYDYEADPELLRRVLNGLKGL